MRQSLPVIAAFLLPIGFSTVAPAGQREYPRPILQQASVNYSRIVGTVRDQTGSAVSGVSVLALGTTLAAAKSDIAGHFAMLLPAGEYILRAVRDGYVSTYREAVRVEGDIPIRRTITLLKTADVAAQPATGVVASATGSEAEGAPDVRVPSEATWRLRHLPRSVLREHAAWQTDDADDVGAKALGSARGPFWSAIDFRGSLDLMTTSSLAVTPGAPLSGDFPRGIAYVVVGAPVGTQGDWIVRAALADEASAWTFVGEYRARADRPHRIRTGVTYSAQTLPSDAGDVRRIAVPSDVLRVGGLYGYDRWSVGRGLEISYGGRFDRYDYLADPNLAGGTVRVTEHLTPGASFFAAASRHMVAPGADQFQPPSVAGVWLPPDRTFSALDSPEPIGAAVVDRSDLGLTFVLSRPSRVGDEDDAGLELGISHFIERTAGQIATVFGLDDASPVGHYHVGTVGNPLVEGVTVEVSGRFGSRARGRVAYAATQTSWGGAAAGNASLARIGFVAAARRGYDVTTAFEGTLPATETRVNLTARMNDWYSMPANRPGVGTRFAVEVQQPLPLRVLGGQAMTLVFGARTLLGDGGTGRSYYDDLVTVDPPLRITCGIQMRF